jgi:hypothetical protein
MPHDPESETPLEVEDLLVCMELVLSKGGVTAASR